MSDDVSIKFVVDSSSLAKAETDLQTLQKKNEEAAVANASRFDAHTREINRKRKDAAAAAIAIEDKKNKDLQVLFATADKKAADLKLATKKQSVTDVDSLEQAQKNRRMALLGDQNKEEQKLREDNAKQADKIRERQVREDERADRESLRSKRQLDKAQKDLLSSGKQLMNGTLSLARAVALNTAANEKDAQAALKVIASFEAVAQTISGVINIVQAGTKAWKAYGIATQIAGAAGVGGGFGGGGVVGAAGSVAGAASAVAGAGGGGARVPGGGARVPGGNVRAAADAILGDGVGAAAGAPGWDPAAIQNAMGAAGPGVGGDVISGAVSASTEATLEALGSTGRPRDPRAAANRILGDAAGAAAGVPGRPVGVPPPPPPGAPGHVPRPPPLPTGPPSLPPVARGGVRGALGRGAARASAAYGATHAAVGAAALPVAAGAAVVGGAVFTGAALHAAGQQDRSNITAEGEQGDQGFALRTTMAAGRWSPSSAVRGDYSLMDRRIAQSGRALTHLDANRRLNQPINEAKREFSNEQSRASILTGSSGAKREQMDVALQAEQARSVMNEKFAGVDGQPGVGGESKEDFIGRQIKAAQDLIPLIEKHEQLNRSIAQEQLQADQKRLESLQKEHSLTQSSVEKLADKTPEERQDIAKIIRGVRDGSITDAETASKAKGFGTESDDRLIRDLRAKAVNETPNAGFFGEQGSGSIFDQSFKKYQETQISIDALEVIVKHEIKVLADQDEAAQAAAIKDALAKQTTEIQGFILEGMRVQRDAIVTKINQDAKTADE